MSDIIKPMLAKDINFDKLKFPATGLMLLPKIDGSFAFVQNSKLYARSLKQHENEFTTAKYSKPEYEGLRGELIAGCDPTAEGLCRDTSSALRTIKGEPVTSFHCFDYVTEETKDLPYNERYNILYEETIFLDNCIRCVKAYYVYNLKEFYYYRDKFIQEGYEGVILRDPMAKHKDGRSSAVNPDLWRWKPWLDAEIIVTGITEGTTNLNEATINELGKTKRSSHKENKVPNGMLGNITGYLLEDLIDVSGKVIQNKGEQVTISAGDMKHTERKFYFDNPNEIIGKIAKFSYFAYGMKDTVRMPQFKTIRSERDM